MITLKAVVSLVVIAAIVYGFYREDKVIAFEQRLERRVLRWMHRTLRKSKRIREWASEEKNTETLCQTALDKISDQPGNYMVQRATKNGLEILIMNAPDIETTTRLWRWNSDGLMFSETGYKGPYKSVMKMFDEAVFVSNE